MISLKNVDSGYFQNGVYYPILKNISIDIQSGEWVSIIGHSGSGKTTLLNCLSGIVHPKNGQVYYGDINIYQLNADNLSVFRRDNIGLVFQDFKLIPYYTSLDNVMIPLVHKEDKSKLKSRAKDVLIQVGLDGKFQSFPHQLSGGEKQRVAIARALVAGPQVLICDEPTGNLDTDTRNQIVNVLIDLKNLGHTIVLVTHDLEITKHSDKLYRMKDGGLQLSV